MGRFNTSVKVVVPALAGLLTATVPIAQPASAQASGGDHLPSDAIQIPKPGPPSDTIPDGLSVGSTDSKEFNPLAPVTRPAGGVVSGDTTAPGQVSAKSGMQYYPCSLGSSRSASTSPLGQGHVVHGAYIACSFASVQVLAKTDLYKNINGSWQNQGGAAGGGVVSASAQNTLACGTDAQCRQYGYKQVVTIGWEAAPGYTPVADATHCSITGQYASCNYVHPFSYYNGFLEISTYA